MQFALAPTLTVTATYAASRGDFLGGSGRGYFANQLDPKYLVLGNLLTQTANAANLAAAQAIVPGIAVPYRTSRAPSARCCDHFHSTPG